MTRLAIGAAIGLIAGVVLGAALSIHADDGVEPDAETVRLAGEAGVDPIELLGAVNTTGLDPRTYLIVVGELAAPVSPPPVARGYSARVRLTYYVHGGATYGGGHTYIGSAACSWNFALGTRFRLPNGEVVTCNDRGLLGSSGWLDLFNRPDLARAYGPFATLEVLP